MAIPAPLIRAGSRDFKTRSGSQDREFGRWVNRSASFKAGSCRIPASLAGGRGRHFNGTSGRG